MIHALNYAAQLMAITASIEASGPPRIKQVYSLRDQIEREATARRARNKARLEAEQARLAVIRAQTPDHVWDRIARDEKRRADRKAAKKEAKKAAKH